MTIVERHRLMIKDIFILWLEKCTNKESQSLYYVSTKSNNILKALVYIGREQDAIRYARTRMYAYGRFEGLLAIWQTQLAQQQDSSITVSELQEIVQSMDSKYYQTVCFTDLAEALIKISDERGAQVLTKAHNAANEIVNIYRKAEVMRQLATTMALTQHENIKAVIYEAQKLTNLSDTSSYDYNLAGLAVDLAEAKRFDYSEQITASIPGYNQSYALRELSIQLAQAHKFDEAKRITESIEYMSEQAIALSKIAEILVPIHSEGADKLFSQARQIAIRIENKDSRNLTLKSIAISLACVQRFVDAEEVSQLIDFASYKLDVSIELAKQNMNAVDILNQVYDVITSIDANTIKAWHLINLAKAMAIITDEHVKDILTKAQTMALSIKSPSDKINVLKSLAETMILIGDKRVENVYVHLYEVYKVNEKIRGEFWEQVIIIIAADLVKVVELGQS